MSSQSGQVAGLISVATVPIGANTHGDRIEAVIASSALRGKDETVRDPLGVGGKVSGQGRSRLT